MLRPLIPVIMHDYQLECRWSIEQHFRHLTVKWPRGNVKWNHGDSHAKTQFKSNKIIQTNISNF